MQALVVMNDFEALMVSYLQGGCWIHIGGTPESGLSTPLNEDPR
jgi:hypothetical protein